MSAHDRFLRACRRESTDRTPVWFMRQAGRALPEYRALRQRYDFLTLCHTPELAAEVTLLPMDRLGVDAAILFADIMLPLEGLGVGFEIRHDAGPVVPRPIRSAADVAALRPYEPRETHAYLLEAVRLVRRALEARHGGRPLIGFAGAPFTLACYLVEGRASRDFPRAKALMFSAPEVWHALMRRLTDAVVDYLLAQVDAGVQAVQLFDSWVGVLAPWDYEAFVLPYTREVFERLAPAGVPRIHFGTGTAALLEAMARAGGDVIGLDWRVDLGEAWARVGPGHAIQGNLDPAVLLGPEALVVQRASRILERAAGRPGHIFNLGHGVLPQTPPDRLRALVEHVHAYRPGRA